MSALQQFLKNKGYFNYPSITGYFGIITQRAVQALQSAEGVVSSGSPNSTGYGRVGPLTRAKIATLANFNPSTTPPPTVSVSATSTAASTTPIIPQPYAPGNGYTPGYGGGGSPTPPPDTTSPTVSITAPVDGATIYGSLVTLSADASDSVGVSGVQFSVNGVNVGSEDTSSPYSITWDSTATSSGSKSIVAVARDSAGNYATSTAVSVTLDNAAPANSSISSGTPVATSTTVTWTTDELADSQINYGTTDGYGSTTTLDSILTTSHSVALSGLTASTTYHYRVRSTDAQGNLAVSSDQTFTTAQEYFFAATRLHYPTTNVAAPTNKEFQTSRLVFGTPAYSVSNPRFFVPGFYTLSTGATPSEFAAPNAFTIYGWGIYTTGGVFVASSTQQFTIDPAVDSVGTLLPALPVTLAANSTYYIYLVVGVSAGQSFLGGYEIQTQNGEGQDGFSTAAAALAKVNGTSMSNNGGVGFTKVFGPAYMVAQGGDNRPVFAVVGDSIAFYKNEDRALAPARGTMGYLARGLDDAASSRRMAYGMLAVPGIKPHDWKLSSNWSRRLSSVQSPYVLNVPFTKILSQLGTNSVSNTDYAANLRADMITYWQLLRSQFSGTTITQAELLPRPSTTDGFQTLGNQTFADDSSKWYTGDYATVYGSNPNAQRWLLNLDIGGQSGDADSASYARSNGYIDDSFAPWKNASYDTSTNRDKWSLRPFTTTLSSGYTANALSMVTVDAPTLGEVLVVDPNSTMFFTIVTAVSGTGPYTVTLTAGKNATYSAGTLVTSAMASDSGGLHPGTVAHIIIDQAVIDWKNARGF